MSRSTHLPLLYNPFLNCIFNNPHHSNQPFRTVIEELAKDHTAYTLLVPPATVLHEYSDETGKAPLRTLCYTSEDFIRSHIIKTKAAVSSSGNPLAKAKLVVYETANGKQVLMKNGMILTGKGFRKFSSMKILSSSYFTSFCDYFPKGSKFMVVYIDGTVMGNPDNRQRNIDKDRLYITGDLNCETNPKKEDKVAKKSTQFVGGVKDESKVTFETLLRAFPIFSMAVSDKFYRLFHHNNHQFRLLRMNTRKKVRHIKLEFQNMLDEAYKIILNSVSAENPNHEQIYAIVNQMLTTYPGVDLNRLVHEYVEHNLYDKLWAQLIFQFNCPNDEDYDAEAMRYWTQDRYRLLSCLALNQLDIPITAPWELNELQLRVSRAIDEFTRLNDTSVVTLRLKTQIFLNTMNILTNGTEESRVHVVVDADTLIGLIIMVVVHSKIENIEAHMYYIKNFNSVDYTDDGHFNYILSNFDAVLFHLDPQLPDLMESSRKNFEFWHAILAKDLVKLEEILEQESPKLKEGEEKAANERGCENIANEATGKDTANHSKTDEESSAAASLNTPVIPANHFFRSKNINGESCVAFAIKSGDFEVYDRVVNHDLRWLSVEDLLFDMNVLTRQNLVHLALSQENTDISDDVVSLILANTTDAEKRVYFNMADVAGRLVGHYLFQNYKLIPYIGHLVNWEQKDANGHTPLCSLCRCYDFSEYVELVKAAMDAIREKYGPDVDLSAHTDRMGNTVMHIVLKGLRKSGILSSTSLVDVNLLNAKSMTPLMLYIKYNRVENLEDLLGDPAVDFLYEDPRNAYNVFDYLGFAAVKASSGLTGATSTFEIVDNMLYSHFIEKHFPHDGQDKLTALNAKYDSSRYDWVIFFKSTLGYSNYKPLSSIRQILNLTKMQHPLAYFPDEETFWRNYVGRNGCTQFFQKLRMNRLIEQLNVLFVLMLYQQTLDTADFFTKFLMEGRKTKAKSKLGDHLLTLESVRKLNKSMEARKLAMGDVKLESSHIQEIEIFLGYSRNDLAQYRSLLARLNKLLSVGDAKFADVCTVEDLAVCRYIYGIEGGILEQSPEEPGFSELHHYTMWLETSVVTLLKNISRVMESLQHWKAMYMELRDLNEMLHKYEGDNAPKRGIFDLDEPPQDDEMDDGGFFGLLENKRTKVKRVYEAKRDKIQAMMKLNVEIKLDHEVIAAEVSDFLRFKSAFMKFAIKMHVQSEIRHHKERAMAIRHLGKRIQLGRWPDKQNGIRGN